MNSGSLLNYKVLNTHVHTKQTYFSEQHSLHKQNVMNSGSLLNYKVLNTHVHTKQTYFSEQHSLHKQNVMNSACELRTL
jgi:hypothetical protein